MYRLPKLIGFPHRRPDDYYKELQERPGWKDLDGEVAMDVGCGSGRNSTINILKYYPKVEKLIAIDNYTPSIYFATSTNTQPKIEYRSADIEDRSTLVEWEGKISKIFSTNCFTHVDPENAFGNVHYLLKPGGEAIITFVSKSQYYDIFLDVILRKEFRQYSAGIANYPKALRQKLDASDYETFLKKSGLTKIICEDERQLFFHEDVESCFMAIRHCNLASDVPSIRRDEFDQDFSQEFLRHIEPDPDDGRFYVKFTVVRIIAKKEN